MLSLLEDNQFDVIEAFNSTSRYLDDLLNIDNNFLDSMVNRLNLPFGTAVKQGQRVRYRGLIFWIYIYLYWMVLSRLKFMIN